MAPPLPLSLPSVPHSVCQVLSQHLLMCWFASFFLFCRQCHRVLAASASASSVATSHMQMKCCSRCSSNSFFVPKLCVGLYAYVCVLAVFTALAKQTNRAYGKEIAHTTMPKWPKMAVGSRQQDLRFWLPSATRCMPHGTRPLPPLSLCCIRELFAVSISLQRLEQGSLTVTLSLT